MTSDGKSEVVFTLKHGDNKQGCAVQPIPGGEVILDTEALSSGEPKPIISNVARGPMVFALTSILVSQL